MTNEDDISDAAKLMIELYGDAAEAEAERMAELMQARGDGEGARLWLRIRRLIELLRHPG